jgi:AraC family L-rhamnose operon regulatory protein RhaS
MIFDTFPTCELLDITVFESATWPYSPERHTHYELVYVLHGRGQHISDQNQYPYQAGNLFLFKASDVHWFCSSEPTRFCVVRLNPQLLHEAHALFAEIPPTFEQSCFQGPPALSTEDQAYVAQQLAFCQREHDGQHSFSDSLVRASLFSVLLLLRRAHTHSGRSATLVAAPESLASKLVEYVRQHLKSPQQLSATAIGNHFCHSPRYVGEYFKRHLGRGLKRFVDESRVYALQQELRFGDQTISQLAFAYGFTDESHLNKVFKAITKQTPCAYRSAWATPSELANLGVGELVH